MSSWRSQPGWVGQLIARIEKFNAKFGKFIDDGGRLRGTPDNVIGVFPSGPVDATDITYAPVDNTDWTGSIDPGDVDDALDQLADRVKTLEGGATADASAVTYTPVDNTDWNASTDPGNVDDALDQLADRVKTLEGGSGHAAVTLGVDADVLLGLTGQQIDLDSQNANLVFAGPTTGAAADPTFRSLVDADIPSAIARDSEVASAISTHEADTTSAHVAQGVNITDAGGFFAATQVEAALQELFAFVSNLKINELAIEDANWFFKKVGTFISQQFDASGDGIYYDRSSGNIDFYTGLGLGTPGFGYNSGTPGQFHIQGSFLGTDGLRIGGDQTITLVTDVADASAIEALVYRIDTEGAAASDDLVTLANFECTIFFLVAADATHTINIKHAVDNVYCFGGSDMVLDDDKKAVLVVKVGSNFLVIGGGGGPPDAADVTFTPADNTDWSGSSDPGDVDNALDQLADRVKTLEGSSHAAVTLAADADVLLGLTGQQLNLDSQAANVVFAGPTSGGAADPTFRALVDADIPAAIARDSEVTSAVSTHEGAADPHTGYVLESLMDAKGDMYGASADNTPAKVPAGTNGYKLETRSSATPGVQWVKDYVSLQFVIDGGGATITTGIKGDLEVPEDLTVESWTILGDQSGSIVVDVWKDTYANYPPTVLDTIAGTEKPTISSALKGQDLSLTSFSTSLTAGDILRFNVDSVSNLQRVTLILKCYRR